MDFEKKEELFEKGKSALEFGRLDEAEEYFTQILEEEPDDVAALNKMGVIYIYRKDKEKAREYFERCLELDPEYVPALSNMGNLELEAGNMNRAEMLYRQALRFDPQYGPAHNNLAHILKKTGRVSEAVSHMKKAQKAGTFSIDYNSSSTQKVNKGCLTIIILSIIVAILWYLTK
ncbi:hypothetical protein BBF96_13230 [Anoxybacter fermentans]|uniref:Uncharacterized protein n=1 Tax=Anoxybacter fermentans TaxID=1323375 RepID=A0A3Q9HRW7_9FIRM|nr:tetratricopeptide repeat protein [Anoxybacter fermentans]AZR74279.1 hypothetical protein BBF96_13230 [Anoxybacter fermentans]